MPRATRAPGVGVRTLTRGEGALARFGFRSPAHGDDGIYYWSTGDDGPLPKGCIHLVQYDERDNVIFELVHTKEANDDGYADFFGSSDRPSTGVHRLCLKMPEREPVDIFRCSFDEECHGKALQTFLSDFLRNRQYIAYTGYDPQPADRRQSAAPDVS